MKKILWIFIPLLIILVIGFQWYVRTKSSLINLDEKVNISLKSLMDETDKRYVYLNSILNLDSLSKNNTELKNYINWRGARNNIISFEYLDMEYIFDSLLVEYSKEKYDVNSPLILTKKEYDTRLNNKVDKYNLSLKDFYQYDLFPKSLVANQLKIEKKKYFEFKYGETSEKPSLKNTRALKAIDSLLIDGLK